MELTQAITTYSHLMTRIDRLCADATRVRRFFETDGSNMSQLLNHFPTGTCGNVSDIFGEWLIERGEPDVEYVHGSREGKSHGWLELENIIIDITSDQFSDGLGPVFVGSKTPFHRSFEDQVRSKPHVFPNSGRYMNG